MNLRYTPLKPKLTKASGVWCIFIPNQVFDKSAVGSVHGPFPSWREGFTAALACSAAMHNNLRFSNAAPIQIRAVN